MNDEQQAAQPVDELDAYVEEAIETHEEGEGNDSESAPEKVEEVATPEANAADEPIESDSAPEQNNVQKRINKLTFEKKEAERQREAAETRLREFEANSKQQEAPIPTLEDFAYDDEKYQQALIAHQVTTQIQTQAQQQEVAAKAQAKESQYKDFLAKIEKFAEKTPDLYESLERMPKLPQNLADALAYSENGVELSYRLSNDPEALDQMLTSSPEVALMKLGQFSERISSKKPPKVKPSAAPEPVAKVSSGGSLNKEPEDMSMEEIYAKL